MPSKKVFCPSAVVQVPSKKVFHSSAVCY
jgi:hypothetical protein